MPAIPWLLGALGIGGLGGAVVMSSAQRLAFLAIAGGFVFYLVKK